MYSSSSIIRITKSRKIRWAEHVARMGEEEEEEEKKKKKNAYRLSVEKPEAKRLLGRWVDNIRMDLSELGGGDVDWIGQAHDRDRLF
jgi:hypothetical protein